MISGPHIGIHVAKFIQLGTDNLGAVAGTVTVVAGGVHVAVVGTSGTVGTGLQISLTLTVGTVDGIAVGTVVALDVAAVAVTVALIAVVAVALVGVLIISESIKRTHVGVGWLLAGQHITVQKAQA